MPAPHAAVFATPRDRLSRWVTGRACPRGPQSWVALGRRLEAHVLGATCGRLVRSEERDMRPPSAIWCLLILALAFGCTHPRRASPGPRALGVNLSRSGVSSVDGVEFSSVLELPALSLRVSSDKDRPLLLRLEAAGPRSALGIVSSRSPAMATVQVLRDGAVIAGFDLAAGRDLRLGTSTWDPKHTHSIEGPSWLVVPASAVSHVDTPGAGDHVYSVRLTNPQPNTPLRGIARNLRLVAVKL